MTTNRIYIYRWHGVLTDEQEKKLAEMGMYKEGRGEYLNMSIGEFVDKWNDKFIAYPPNQQSMQTNDWLVGVTKFPSFGQRG